MNEKFNDFCRKIIKDKNILFDPDLSRTVFTEHSNDKYKNEIRLLLVTVESGYPKIIDGSDDIDSLLFSLSKRLTEENYIIEKIAASMIKLLICLVKGMDSFPVKKTAVLEVDEINRQSETWICGRCSRENSFELDFCEKCGKEFNPPL